MLGLDVGTKRVGLAISDPNQTVATPLGVVTRRVGKRFPLNALRPVLAHYAPVGVVVGLPLTAEGGDDRWTAEVRLTAQLIAEKTGLPVALWDERMTTARVVAAASEAGTGTGGADLDRLAATVLLQGFLDRRRA